MWPKLTVSRNHLFSPHSICLQFRSIFIWVYFCFQALKVWRSILLSTKTHRIYFLVYWNALLFTYFPCWCSYDVQARHSGLTGFNEPGKLDEICYATFSCFPRIWNIIFSAVTVALKTCCRPDVCSLNLSLGVCSTVLLLSTIVQ